MSNAKTLELRTLDDEELLDVVGGCDNGCQPRRCEPCDDDLDIDIDVHVDLVICV
jgi:hypothetical protein